MPQSRATMKYVRTSPRKMRRVVDLIRGEHVEEARRILRFSSLGASNDIEKLLNSAIANAEQNPGVIAENLVVARGWVDQGPTLKRFRPRAYGRATRVRKRTAHVTLGEPLDVARHTTSRARAAAGDLTARLEAAINSLPSPDVLEPLAIAPAT